MFPPLTANEEQKPSLTEAEIWGTTSTDVCDGGRSMEVLFKHCFNRLRPEVQSQMAPATTSLTGFSGETIWPVGQIRFLVTIGDAEHSTEAWMNRYGLAIHPDFPDQEISIGDTLSPKGERNNVTLKKKPRHIRMSPILTYSNGEEARWELEDVCRLYGPKQCPPQDCYPLPEIRLEIKSPVRSTLSKLSGPYKGYHQIQMAEEDEEKTAFHTPRGGKRSNIEETFRTLRKINMKLNPKKCTFGTVEGMFLGYVVGPEGIKPCPDKVERCTYNSSSRTIKEVPPQCLVSGFDSFSISQVSRSKNKKADALSKIASTSFAHLSKQVLVEILNEKSINGKEVAAVVEEEEPTWMTPIVEYLRDGILPEDSKDASKLRIKARQYELLQGVLYRRSFLKPWLRQGHAFWILLANHAPRCAGYDTQVQGLPDTSSRLTLITAPWPFYKWGIDIAGPFPEGPGKVKFLIVAMDYFTKWIEAKAVATISGTQVKKFVWNDIVCRFGLPGEIISDNGKQFSGDPFKDWCEKLNIVQRFASVKHPQSNRLVERANRSLGEGIKARLGENNKNWLEELPHVLWAHRTMIKSSNDDTPFSLTYGTEAVIPAEIGMPTYRTTAVDVVHNDDELRLNLDLVEERRERAAIREAQAKLKMKRYYDARVKNVAFRPGDFVYRSNDASHAVEGGKLGPKWEGPYEVLDALGDGAYKLRSSDGTVLPRTWNVTNLKKCYL
ncbi:reverse transcriptase domain-containing protein [Tanacetum coccineum]|uniref:Reverse transcriptase domain-containing protein n=1 Tax=Tanacetum coccineum TaxID=301880 RepID=A0ABQ4XUU2_9ASTR